MTGWFEQATHELMNLDMAQVEQWLLDYASLGPLPGIILPLSEAILSFLPLFVIIIGNASAYGLWLGFLYSWIGTSLGALLVFWLARRFGKRFSIVIVRKFPKTERLFKWSERKGFTPLFLLYCFPFIPSLLVNIASGMSAVSFKTFLAALLMGKAVMVFVISFVGHDWQAFISQPWRIAVLVVMLFLLWFAGKKLEKRFQLEM
ncbi:TVP38/TMEM64 family protein [Paenibacillus sp. MBLB4367]|uniref:TVP38/TMEM64 family protein n=1 Tax=Paenibacillus sp. MBLB4367 TaxID=3384767 RepID=UPI0039081A2A